ncbi:MAG: hypothetical protein CL784_06515 [Chloroflexi bacterium]|nr:hypothetical protein [Chloroflexota bacterium]
MNKKHRHFGGAFFVESLLWVGLDDRLEKLHMCIFNFDYDLPHVNARFFSMLSSVARSDFELQLTAKISVIMAK